MNKQTNNTNTTKPGFLRRHKRLLKRTGAVVGTIAGVAAGIYLSRKLGVDVPAVPMPEA